MKKLSSIGPLLIVIAASLWAIDGIIRRSLYVLPPVTIVFYEHLVGALILLPFIIKYFRSEKLNLKEWGLVAWVSLLSSLLGTLWFTTALLSTNFISFSVVYLIQKLQPVFAISAAYFLLGERINKKYFMWAGLALASAYFVTFKDGAVNLSTGQGTVIAALYALGAAFAWGSSTAVSRMVLIKHPPQFITGVRFILATIFALVAVYMFGQQQSLPTVDVSQIGRFALIAVSTGMVALLLYYKGLKHTEAKVSTILELVYPLLAVVIDGALYHSFLSVTQYLAGAVLLFAIYRISKIQKKTT